MLLNAAKCQGYSFYRFWVIKEKPTRVAWGGGITSPFTQIRINEKSIYNLYSHLSLNETHLDAVRGFT